MNDRIAAMERIFSPRSVAFVGASNNLGKWGGIILHNLIRGGYEGAIYPVNPGAAEVQGRKAFKSVADIPGPVDLAIFTIPAESMPDAISDCTAKKIPAGIVISAGFSELGDGGRELEAEMLRRARSGGMVLVGPNGQGISAPHSKLHPWMPVFKPAPGVIGIASQSGNVVTVVAEQLSDYGFGCSKAISAGNCADVTFVDYLDYFRRDPATRVVILYVEGVGDGPGFFRSARQCALDKPVVIIKGGRTSSGSRAASTHTGVLAGTDAVFSAACRQAGLVLAETLEDAVILAAAFAGTPPATGRRVGMVTGGGGFGVIAADACTRSGLEVSPLSEATIAKLRKHLPPWWSPNNPVDMVAGLGYGGPRELLPILMESGEFDGLILLGIGWVYQMMDPVDSKVDFKDLADERLQSRLAHDIEFCGQLAEFFKSWDRPILMTSSVARLAVRRGYPGLVRMLRDEIMLYPTIESAVMVFKALSDRHEFFLREGRIPG